MPLLTDAENLKQLVDAAREVDYDRKQLKKACTNGREVRSNYLKPLIKQTERRKDFFYGAAWFIAVCELAGVVLSIVVLPYLAPVFSWLFIGGALSGMVGALGCSEKVEKASEKLVSLKEVERISSKEITSDLEVGRAAGKMLEAFENQFGVDETKEILGQDLLIARWRYLESAQELAKLVSAGSGYPTDSIDSLEAADELAAAWPISTIKLMEMLALRYNPSTDLDPVIANTPATPTPTPTELSLL